MLSVTGDSDSVTVAVQCYLLLVECDRSAAAKHSAAAALVTERQNWGEYNVTKKHSMLLNKARHMKASTSMG